MNFDFLHCADIHVGKSRNVPGYLSRQAQAIDWIYDVARKNNTPTIVVAGDLFEREVIKDAERETLISRLLKYDKEGFTTVIIPGNHDWQTETRLTLWDLVLLQEHGKFKNTFIIWKEPQKLTVNDIDYLCIPSLGPKLGRSSEDLANIFESFNYSERSVAVLHEMFLGATNDLGFKFPKGCSITSKKRPTYGAIGDVHRQQRCFYGYWYCGAPIQHDFGDRMPKGCLLVDLDEPDNPHMETSDHIKQFVITNKIEETYQDAFIKYIGSRTDLPLNASENILQIQDTVDQQTVLDYTSAQTVDLIEGLPEFLAGEGLNKDEQAFAIGEIENIIQKEGLNIVY